MTTKSVQDRFNFKDLPRDGRVMVPARNPKLSVEIFLMEASQAAYVIVQRMHWIWLLENGLAESDSNAGFFVALPMTPAAMRAGIVGKVGSTMVFSDVYATLDDSYDKMTPITFAPHDGLYMQELERSRCPYFLIDHNIGMGIEIEAPEFSADEFMWAWNNGMDETQVASISIPAKYWNDFYPWVVENQPDSYVVTSDPATQMNGFHGTFRGVPVYTDAFLIKGLRSRNDVIYFELKPRG